MSRLVLMRHAKAVPAGSVDDFDRPLAQTGLDDCVTAAAWLNNQPWRIDEALVSSALRTRQTFESVKNNLNYPLAARFVEEIYEASAGEILAQIRQASLETLLVIGHSPGIPRLAVALARGDIPRDLPSEIGRAHV